MDRDDTPGPSAKPPGEEPEMDEEFRFLLCEKCREEAGCPKLLPCLHNVCTECLQETKPINCCPVCQAPHSQADGATNSIQDNLLFANLRAKLSVFRMIKSGQDLVCQNCNEEGTYWCSDCQEFLCSVCYRSHQRYLKKENHEPRAVKDIRANSYQAFLNEFKNSTIMFCSNTEHRMQNLSIYCRACQRSMCCICTVLDSRHNGQHCPIREEILRRQQELQRVSTELREKEASYDRTCSNLRELVNNMVKVKNETQSLIEQKVAEMVRLVQEKGERLLTSVREQHERRVQETERELHNVELVVQRMESCKQLVEKMHLYAFDQEVMDMYPFIRESLEELKRKQPPVVEAQIPVGNFAEVETQLQAFYERVTREPEAAPTPPVPVVIVSNPETVGKTSAKRKNVLVGDSSLTPTKLIKTGPDNGKQKQSSGQVNQEQPGTSSGDHPTGNGDNVWRGKDATVISDDWFPISSSDSSDTETPSCLNGSGEDVESVGSIQPKDVSSESSQDDVWRNIFQPLRQLFSGQGSLVFFDLQVLPDRTLHLVAVVDEAKLFSVIIQPLLSAPSGGMKGGLCEFGLDPFLRYLLSVHQPILVGYDLWAMDFPVLVDTLKAIKKEEVFKAAIFGFLDALPLIKEAVPNLPSYTLRALDRMYLWGQLNDNSQVIDFAKTVKDLCTILDVTPVMEGKPVITYSSLQAYISLQPLLARGLLNHSTGQALALHGVCLSVLLTVYNKDPARGLEKFARYLNSRQISGGKTIQQLGRARAYFEALPSMSGASTSGATMFH